MNQLSAHSRQSVLVRFSPNASNSPLQLRVLPFHASIKFQPPLGEAKAEVVQFLQF